MGRAVGYARGEGPTQGWARAERTANIELMSVTLEVSKLSGWLNALAYCRESQGRACGVVRGAAREAGGVGRPRRKQRAGRARVQIRGGRSARRTCRTCP